MRLSVCTMSWRRSASTQPSAEVMPGKRGTSARLEPDLADQRADMQRAAAAERHGDEARRIVAALDRNQADRAGHARFGDAHDRRRGVVGGEAERLADMGSRWRACAASTSSDFSSPPSGRAALMRPSTTWASVSVGRVLPCAVAGRARHRAGAFRADLQQAAAIDRGDRAAARADGGDLDHRRADHQAEIDRGLRRDRDLAAGDQRDVERGAAEIAGDEIVEAGGLGERRAGDHAGGRAGQRGAHRQLPRGRGRHDAAVRLHDVQLAGKLLRRQRGCRACRDRRRRPAADRRSAPSSRSARTRGFRTAPRARR